MSNARQRAAAEAPRPRPRTGPPVTPTVTLRQMLENSGYTRNARGRWRVSGKWVLTRTLAGMLGVA